MPVAVEPVEVRYAELVLAGGVGALVMVVAGAGVSWVEYYAPAPALTESVLAG
jgi:hypothetical protein